MSQEKRGGYLEAIVREPGDMCAWCTWSSPAAAPGSSSSSMVQPPGGHVSGRPADVGFSHICVACPDVDGLLERLVAAGDTPRGPLADVDTGANAVGRARTCATPTGMS